MSFVDETRDFLLYVKVYGRMPKYIYLVPIWSPEPSVNVDAQDNPAVTLKKTPSIKKPSLPDLNPHVS